METGLTVLFSLSDSIELNPDKSAILAKFSNPARASFRVAQRFV